MPRKNYRRKPGVRPIGKDRRYKVRSKQHDEVNRRKYVAAMARYAVAQAEKEAQEYEATAQAGSGEASAASCTARADSTDAQHQSGKSKPSNTVSAGREVSND